MINIIQECKNCIIILFKKNPCKNCIVRPACTKICPDKEELHKRGGPIPHSLAKMMAVMYLFSNAIIVVMSIIGAFGFLSFLSS